MRLYPRGCSFLPKIACRSWRSLGLLEDIPYLSDVWRSFIRPLKKITRYIKFHHSLWGSIGLFWLRNLKVWIFLQQGQKLSYISSLIIHLKCLITDQFNPIFLATMFRILCSPAPIRFLNSATFARSSNYFFLDFSGFGWFLTSSSICSTLMLSEDFLRILDSSSFFLISWIFHKLTFFSKVLCFFWSFFENPFSFNPPTIFLKTSCFDSNDWVFLFKFTFLENYLITLGRPGLTLLVLACFFSFCVFLTIFLWGLIGSSMSIASSSESTFAFPIFYHFRLNYNQPKFNNNLFPFLFLVSMHKILL